MNRGRRLGIALLALAATTATSGCGLGEGESSEGEATLTVTRDYGSEILLEATEPEPPASETVLRMLDREAEITTRYGGGFVQSIDGMEGEVERGRSRDWFFFVNGVESARGAAEVEVRGGDRIWWDHRDWSDALRTPAVVGSWPEPFAQASAGSERLPVRVDCFGERRACNAVGERLAEESVDASVEGARRPANAGTQPPALRLLVGPWGRVRRDPVAAQLEGGPQESGVFARFTSSGGGYRLLALDERGEPATRLGAGSGLIAGLRRGEQPPAWLVTGTDTEGVEEALSVLTADQLTNRYAVAAGGARELALPVDGE